MCMRKPKVIVASTILALSGLVAVGWIRSYVVGDVLSYQTKRLEHYVAFLGSLGRFRVVACHQRLPANVPDAWLSQDEGLRFQRTTPTPDWRYFAMWEPDVDFAGFAFGWYHWTDRSDLDWV